MGIPEDVHYLIKLVFLLEERIELQTALLSKKMLRSQSHAGAELSMHNRDKHNNYWDHESYLEWQRKEEAEISKVWENLNENKKAIVGIKKEMRVEQNCPSYTAHLRESIN